ncbi:response regulator transcription factor [Actinomadura craniellae]|uniref:response regulator transcription factor n=1 Tax=Actinomadura craniellae TaxID=2231787 RepID=UPI001F4903FA|nr:response regulator transcription factor [Actinomadura craniellae]
MIRVLIVEDAPLLRSGLVSLLSGVPDIALVTAIERGGRLELVARQFEPDVMLIDIDSVNGDVFELVQKVRAELTNSAAILMAERCRPGDLRRAAEAGAAGFVLKDTSPDELVSAILGVARGERFIDADLVFAELAAAESPLTPRELEVLRLAGQGASAEEIAADLVLTTGTVRNHLSRINRKIGARNRIHAIRIAESAGWL